MTRGASGRRTGWPWGGRRRRASASWRCTSSPALPPRGSARPPGSGCIRYCSHALIFGMWIEADMNCLDRICECLAARIRERLSPLRYSVQHGCNDGFPWWVVARFVNGVDEDKAIDVSIECSGTLEGWIIRADLSRGNGLVLQELSRIPPPSSSSRHPRRCLNEEMAGQLEAFLLGQVPYMIQELL